MYFAFSRADLKMTWTQSSVFTLTNAPPSWRRRACPPKSRAAEHWKNSAMSNPSELGCMTLTDAAYFGNNARTGGRVRRKI